MEALIVRKERDDYLCEYTQEPTYQQLEDDMTSLLEMFADFHDLVYIHQPMLDIIENNISDSRIKVEKAEEELQIAVVCQGKNRKLIIGCMGGLACFAIFGPVGVLSKVAVCSIGGSIVYTIS